MIGKNQYNLQQDKFVALYLKSLIPFNKEPIKFKITSSMASQEGAGVQALLILYAINFANDRNCEYLHTRFSKIGHSDRPTQEYAHTWEQYFNLGLNETPVLSTTDNVINLPASFRQIKLVYKINNFSVFSPHVLANFKSKFYNDKQKPIKRLNQIDICLHIRRGDVTQKNSKDHWTDHKKNLNCVKQAIKILDRMPLNYQIKLFSEGNVNDFKEFERLGVMLFLNKDPIWSHLQLVNADILIMAKSTYSYTAALLCDGLILYEKNRLAFKISPRPEWIVRSSDGFFDKAQVVEKLTILDHVSLNG